MDAVSASVQMTAQEFLAMGEDPYGRRWQLVDGELVMNEPSWTHNDSAETILHALGSWVREAPRRGRAGLPLDVQMDDRNVYAPDVVWYRDGRQPKRGDPAPYAVPDLAVEIRSPSTWRYDIGIKKAKYEQHGVAELWLVDTEADVVLVFRRSDAQAPRFDVSLELTAEDTLTSPLLPGFALAVGEVFVG